MSSPINWQGNAALMSKANASRSMGLKLLVVCGLALLMSIPALFVSSIVDERTSRAAAVVTEISSHVGGQQTFLGPTLAIPYEIPYASTTTAAKHGTYLIFPAEAKAEVKTTTEERHRSLFRVPVFEADVKLAATFDLAGMPAAAPEGAVLDWDHAEIVVGVSDARGARSDAVLNVNGASRVMTPASTLAGLTLGPDGGEHVRLTLFGTHAAELAKAGGRFAVTSSLRFSGAQRLALLAYGKTTQVAAQGDWKNPGFDGGFLPVNRAITGNGFTAQWSVPFIARGVRAEGDASSLSGLEQTALGVSFVEVADPYQSVNRSLKYVLLFLGLVFLSYFVFEVTTHKRVHPAQYLLVGVAQIVFYLLLLSLAERIGFDLAFLCAGVATVLLLSANAEWVFGSRRQGARAFGVFSLLYVLIYLLLRLEDNALLVGATASFIAIAAVMYATRRIDWYGVLTPASTAAEPAPVPLAPYPGA